MKKKVIFIMVDGFGVPDEGWDNSIFKKYCRKGFIDLFKNCSVPIDATLGIEGIPQSATGQTALFTGLNAAELIGRHCAAFPGKQLKLIIAENNIFLKVKELGLKPVFANAYLKFELEKIYFSRYCSVTSAMTYSIQKKTFNTEDLISGECVYHDITNWTVGKDYKVPVIEPETAAGNLLHLSEKNDFTLFEYFLTDRAGHGCNEDELARVLDDLSGFVLHIFENQPDGTVFILTSDHGNCENAKGKIHTLNNVPLLVTGLEKNLKSTIKSIVDVYGLVVDILKSQLFIPINLIEKFMNYKEKTRRVKYEFFKFFHIMRREVWSADIHDCFFVFRPVLFLYRFFYFVLSDFANKKTLMMASALSYATVLGIIPITMVIIGLSKGFLEESLITYTPKIIDFLVEKLLPFFKELPNNGGGEQLYQSIQNYINFQLIPNLTNLNLHQIGLYGAIVLIVISLSLIRTIEKAFNDIWGVILKRSIWKLILRYWLVIAFFPAAILVILWITGFNVFQDVLRLKDSLWGTKLFGDQVFTVIALWLLFAVVYKVIPNTNVKILPAFIGGIIGGTLWQLNNTLSFLFVSNALRTHYIYGSIGVVPIFLISLFVGWLIVLFGAHIAYGVQNLEFFRIRLLTTDLQPSDHQEIAVLFCAIIAIRMIKGEEPPTADELSKQSGLPVAYFSEIIHTFTLRKIIYETDEETPRYILCVSPESIRLKSIVDTAIGHRNDKKLPLVSNKKLWHASIRLCTNYRNSYTDTSNPTLKEIAEKLGSDLK